MILVLDFCTCHLVQADVSKVLYGENEVRFSVRNGIHGRSLARAQIALTIRYYRWLETTDFPLPHWGVLYRLRYLHGQDCDDYAIRSLFRSWSETLEKHLVSLLNLVDCLSRAESLRKLLGAWVASTAMI